MIERPIYLSRIFPFIDKPVIKILTGVRRCGKSTLLKLLIRQFKQKGILEKQIIFINKDSLEFEFIQSYLDLYRYVKEKRDSLKEPIKFYLFIDEIQEISEWEKAILSLFDDDWADVFLTGSNANLLSSELATRIAGRYIEIPVQTLIFREYVLFRSGKENRLDVLFDEFLRYGGFPGIHHMEFDYEIIRQYLDAIYNTVLLKDVIERNAIRDVSLLDRIATFSINNIGNPTTALSISKYLKSQHIRTAPETVLNYLKYLCDALITYKTNRYDIKGKAQLELFEKYYMSDIGFVFAKLGDAFSDISGKLENIVFLELRARGYEVQIGKLNQFEVDFIAQKDGKKVYIQVAYLLANEQTIIREFSVLNQIKDNYPKIVLSLDKHFGEDHGGIQWMNLIAFLMNDKIV